ncbi:MAG: hypothetical protein N3G75_03555 [Methanothrix sp.]|nr:hypothetical protein [Methanothrix sp.]MCX8206890.1 hypothetical protein [Methanothrix sp.]
MFKLGEYDELTAKDLADRLREMKIRVDIRPSIVADLKIRPVLQGRFSELKNEIEDERTLKKYEHYLEALRKTFAEKPAPEEFYKRYQTYAVPQWVKIAERIEALMTEIRRAEAATKETSSEVSPHEAAQGPPEKPSPDESAHEETSPEAAGTSDEVEDVDYDILIDNKAAAEFLEWVFSLNKLEIDEDPGDKLNDPIIAIPVMADDYSEHPMRRTNIHVNLEKAYDLYIDEWSAFTCEDPDKDFFDEFQNEAIEILAINAILRNLTDVPPSGKVDMESFVRMCGVYMEMESGIFNIDAYGVAEDLAKILEKNGVVKIKGDTIRWKKV